MKKINVKGAVMDNDSAWFYDYFGMDYTSPKSVADVLNNGEVDDVVVNISSPGGDVFAASEIYSELKAYPGNVTVNVQGLAASAASVIAMAGDTVNMAPTAQLMIHKASTTQGGNSDDMDSASAMLNNTDKSIANAYQLKTGKSQADLLQMMSNETWLNAQDAVNQGFADSIMFVDENAPLVTNSLEAALPPKSAVNKLMNIIANEKRQEMNNKTDSQPVDDLKARKLAILLDK